MFGKRRVVWLLLVAVTPATGEAQLGIPAWNRCQQCQTAPRPIVAPPVMIAPVCPQVQTSYRQEHYVTYQPVTRTQVRREAVAVTVPVTTQKQVTVDEGGYQMVWVPKLRTKTVAETKLQQQVQYRDVPYQVVENVPRVQTRLVPQRTVMSSAPRLAVAPGCCQPGMFSASVTPTWNTAVLPTLQPLAAVPTPFASSDVTPRQVSQPTPQPAEWTKVPQKRSTAENAAVTSEIELQSFQQFSKQISATGMFSKPASTASALKAGRLN